MSELRPFRALRFRREPGPRIAGPYDVISAEEREALAREPENIVHLTLPTGSEGERDYEGAARTLARWKDEDVLVRDPTPRIYTLEERVSDGRVRRGFLALVRLADYGERIVLPHERTLAGPKRDRLLLTRAVRANLEPIFFLYEDRDDKLRWLLDAGGERDALARCEGPDGTGLRLGAIEDSAQISALQGFLADRSVIIADGHHRYETLLRYRDECREAGEPAGSNAPHEYLLAYLVNAFDPGSQVRAIHRALRGSTSDPGPGLRAAGFRLEERGADESAASLLELLGARRASEDAFVFLQPDGRRVLAARPRGKPLAVEVLHSEILPALGGDTSFDSRPERLLRRVRDGELSLGILLAAIDPESLFRVVQAGAVLPQKSTFFSPKIPSGLVLRDLVDPADPA